MAEEQAAARQQQRVDALCAAAMRALCGQRDLHFVGQRLHRGRQRLRAYAPHLHPHQDAVLLRDFSSFRGSADGLALRLRWSDEALHQRLAPAEPVRRLLFDMLEQFRVEALAAGTSPHPLEAESWPGVRHNLQHRFRAWTLASHHAGLTNSARGMLLFTVAQMGRARVCAEPVDEEVVDRIEGTRAGIGPLIGPALGPLRAARFEQALYAVHALQMADAVARLLESSGNGAALNKAAQNAKNSSHPAFGSFAELEDLTSADANPAAGAGGRSENPGAAPSYRIFTTAYDQVRAPEKTLRREQLANYRQRLDTLVTDQAAQGVNVRRLARQLQAMWVRPVQTDWAGAQEEGLIDGAALSQWVASPTERRIFRQALQTPKAGATLSFLIDCSGSMRQHIEHVALLVDVMTRALDMAGITSEVLGFSTGAWNGGRALRDWQRAGQAPQPGRVAELAHLVFKDAQTPWRQARYGLAALLQPELFREGVDGEALAWAAQRLRAAGAENEADNPGDHRKLLVVLSDGCPMEAATARANDAAYLHHHLQQVAGDIQAAGDIELLALGVGLDLSPYYRRAQVLDLAQGVSARVLQEVVALLARRSRA